MIAGDNWASTAARAVVSRQPTQAVYIAAPIRKSRRIGMDARGREEPLTGP